MFTLVVVKIEPGAEVLSCFCDRVVGVGEYSFVFQATPQALDKDIVEEAASAIHTDLYALCRQRFNERRRRKLRALVGVEDFRLAAVMAVFAQLPPQISCFLFQRGVLLLQAGNLQFQPVNLTLKAFD